MAVYGYTRVSTQSQSEHGYGLAAQEQAIRKFAKDNGIELAGLYTDAGISGNLKDDDDDDAINKRAGLIDMLAALTDGDDVLVLNTSRLWRSDMTKAIVRRELIKRNAHVISIEQPRYDLYSKDPNDYLINAIMESLDVFERMNVSIKLARGRSVKARGGDKPAGRTPYGYRYTSDRKHVEVVPDEAKQVKRMFSAAQTGKSLQQIADMLNADGITTKAGNEWCRGSVRAILKNNFYTGTLTHAGEEIKGNHPAVISRVQYGKVQAQLEKHHK